MTVNIDELVFVREYLKTQLSETGQDIGTSELAGALLDFEDIFEGGIAHMYNFVGWMQTHGYTAHEILPALVHDLNGRKDVCFLPRTSTY
jgi:hypothetical protein